MSDFDNKKNQDERGGYFNQDIHSSAIRAGKRTYFFDVKSTRRDEYYLTITESKKKFEEDGRFVFEKHKIFLYQEDFVNFVDSLQEMIKYINDNQISIEPKVDAEVENNFPDIEFDDLTN